jgi:hypothetical protein
MKWKRLRNSGHDPMRSLARIIETALYYESIFLF